MTTPTLTRADVVATNEDYHSRARNLLIQQLKKALPVERDRFTVLYSVIEPVYPEGLDARRGEEYSSVAIQLAIEAAPAFLEAKDAAEYERRHVPTAAERFAALQDQIRAGESIPNNVYQQARDEATAEAEQAEIADEGRAARAAADAALRTRQAAAKSDARANLPEFPTEEFDAAVEAARAAILPLVALRAGYADQINAVAEILREGGVVPLTYMGDHSSQVGIDWETHGYVNHGAPMVKVDGTEYTTERLDRTLRSLPKWIRTSP